MVDLFDAFLLEDDEYLNNPRTESSSPVKLGPLVMLDTETGFRSWNPADVPNHKQLSMEIDHLFLLGEYEQVLKKCLERFSSFCRPYPGHLRPLIQTYACCLIRHSGSFEDAIDALQWIVVDMDRGKMTDAVVYLTSSALCGLCEFERALQLLSSSGLPYISLLAKILHGLGAEQSHPEVYRAIAARQLDVLAEIIESHQLLLPYSDQPFWIAPLCSLLRIRPPSPLK